MTKSPLDIYYKRVDEKALKSDQYQLGALALLDGLYDDLMEEYERPSESLFQKMAGLIVSSEEPIKGVYLYGGVGRGKSMVMDMFFDCLPDGMKKRRVHFHVFMIEVHEFLHDLRKAGGKKGVDAALPHLAMFIADDVQILCFDEFHVSDVADAMILSRLFAALMASGVVIVATSNWQPERLYEGGLQRELFLPFIDLIKAQMNVFGLDGSTDYRAECLAVEGSYFQPLNKKSAKQIDDVFAHLSGGVNPHEDVLEVKGRRIKVERVAAGAARFSFDQLCAGAYGAEDYLEISSHYPVIFLEDIPVLKDEDRNEAKRLMTLIDVLYEARVKLVISADSPPDKIYQGADHGFEFQRTVSRLQEMQSAQYLKS